MKKYLSLLLILTIATLFAGCGNNKLDGTYDKMKISKDLESYQLDLRIYGTYENKRINEIVRIDNYKGTQYKIDYISNNTDKTNIKEEEATTTKDNALYIIDGIKYLLDEENTYKETSESYLYTKPELYLVGLKNIDEDDYLREEAVSTNKYKVYSIEVTKEDMNKILDDSTLSNVVLTKEVTGEAWLNEDGLAYKTIYNVNTGIKDTGNALIINASYFRINKISEIKNQININKTN